MEIIIIKQEHDLGVRIDLNDLSMSIKLNPGESITINNNLDGTVGISPIQAMNETPNDLNPYPHSQFDFNSNLGIVTFADQIKRLTKKENNLLELLMTNINKLTSYDKLRDYYQPLFPNYADQKTMIDSMKAIVSRLRRKLPESGNKISQYQSFDDHFIRSARTHGFFIYDPHRGDFDESILKA